MYKKLLLLTYVFLGWALPVKKSLVVQNYGLDRKNKNKIGWRSISVKISKNNTVTVNIKRFNKVL